MTVAGLEITEFRPAFRAELVALWARLFAGRRHYRPLDRGKWVREIERPGFEPAAFRVATVSDRVVGFVHGGIWDQEFLRLARPQHSVERVAFIAMVGVMPELQRRGIGRALVADLQRSFAPPAAPPPPIEPDGRMFNPFYGNSVAPRPPLWGTTEGAAVPWADAATRGFFRELGFREEAQAQSRLTRLDEALSSDVSWPPGYEAVCEPDYRPALGTSTGRTFGETNRSRTWIAAEGLIQRAALVAYPFDDEEVEWAIYSLEVDPERRGRGLGSALLRHALHELRVRHDARTVETLVIPEESPAALRLYEAHGFEVADRWVILGPPPNDS